MKRQENVIPPRIGEVYFMYFDGCVNEQRGWRPGLVFQNNLGNIHSPNIIALPLTSAIKKAHQPTHVVIPSRGTGLMRDSMVLCENPQRMSKERLGAYITTIPAEYMRQVACAHLLATAAISFLYYTVAFAFCVAESQSAERGRVIHKSQGRFCLCKTSHQTIVDQDYYYAENEGHILLKITNDSKENKSMVISYLDRVVQGIFVKFGITFDDDDEKATRSGGLGSTGKSTIDKHTRMWYNKKVLMREKKFYRSEDIADMLSISKTSAYRIIHTLNEELKRNGYITIAGRIPSAFFDQRFYSENH